MYKAHCWEEKFNDVIFTDKCTFQLECHRRYCFRKNKMPRKLKFKRKHPPKMYVWAGISKRGATKIVMFSRIMIATRYFDILSASLVPFLKERSTHMVIICIRKTILNIRVSIFSVFCCKWSTVVEESSWVPRRKPNRDAVRFNEDLYPRQGHA